jgi:hypothetical protein
MAEDGQRRIHCPAHCRRLLCLPLHEGVEVKVVEVWILRLHLLELDANEKLLLVIRHEVVVELSTWVCRLLQVLVFLLNALELCLDCLHEERRAVPLLRHAMQLTRKHLLPLLDPRKLHLQPRRLRSLELLHHRPEHTRKRLQLPASRVHLQHQPVQRLLHTLQLLCKVRLLLRLGCA